MANTTRTEQPKYLTVASDLRRQIVAGELKPGQRLPSYARSRSQGISQPTIERAHAVLEKEGYVLRLPHRGSFVADVNDKSNLGYLRPQNAIMSKTVAVLTQSPLCGIGVVWCYNEGMGVLESLRQNDYKSLLVSSDGSQLSDLHHLQQDPPIGIISLEYHPDAISLREYISAVRLCGCPAVFNSLDTELRSFDLVGSDHEDGAYQLTKWLIERGRKRILNLLPNMPDAWWIIAKRAGYERAMAEANLEPLYVTIDQAAQADGSLKTFQEETRRYAGHLVDFMMDPNRIDAVMVYTDKLTYIIAAACRLFRLVPNEDIDVVGYDNVWDRCDYREFETPPLATINKNGYAQGIKMVELLLARIKGNKQLEPQHVLIPPQLILTDKTVE